MTFIEKVCITEQPDAYIMFGDTNSTLAGALIAAKEKLPLNNIEVGLRSFIRKIPEQVNRIIVDDKQKKKGTLQY